MTDRTAARDEDVLKEVAQGEEAAFAELLRRYENAILTFCYSFTRERGMAEDLAQETFLRVYRNAARYKPVAKFSTWLYKIAANLCINEIKRNRLRPVLALDEPAGSDPEGTRVIERLASGDDTPLTGAEKHEIQSLIRSAIDHLPDDQRTTLVLVEYHHLQYQEIAEILGVSVSAIKMRVKRARETLKELLKVLQMENR